MATVEACGRPSSPVWMRAFSRIRSAGDPDIVSPPPFARYRLDAVNRSAGLATTRITRDCDMPLRTPGVLDPLTHCVGRGRGPRSVGCEPASARVYCHQEHV